MAKRPNFYDYLKIVAVITMIIDHLGYYFFPDQVRMRLVGRIAFPIFLFLVGFSNSYKRRRDIFIMALIIQISMWIGYHYVHIGTLQLNILWAIIGVRLFLGRYQHHHQYRLLILISILLIGMHFSIGSWIDYGMLSWGLGIFGFLVRKNSNQKDNDSSPVAKLEEKSRFIMSFRLCLLGPESNRIHTIYYGILILFCVLIYNIIQFGFWDFGSGQRISWIHIGFYPLLLYIFFYLGQQNRTLRINKKWDNCVLLFSSNALLVYGIHLFILVLIKWLFVFPRI